MRDAEQALAAVLDALVPPRDEGRLPGAGTLGLAAAVHDALAPELRPMLVQGLASLDALARERGAAGFAALSEPARGEALDRVAAEHPGILPTLALLTYRAYYEDPRVLEALGLEPRPPFPKGYAMEPTDFTELLAPVRARPPLYRKA